MTQHQSDQQGTWQAHAQATAPVELPTQVEPTEQGAPVEQTTQAEPTEQAAPTEQPAPVSVLMSLYAGTTSEDLAWSLASLLAQTRPAAQVVLVFDGPVATDVARTATAFQSTYPHTVTILPLEKNQGLGPALNAGLQAVTQPIVARLDSDDFAHPRRFAQQLTYLEQHPNVHVLGTAIAEFQDSKLAELPAPSFDLEQHPLDHPAPNQAPHQAIHQALEHLGYPDRLGLRRLPETHAAIASYAKLNNPINHPSVMIRTDTLREVHGYQHVPMMEDYDLFARLLSRGKQFHNLPEPLTLFRTSPAVFDRRTGRDMLRYEVQMQRNLFHYGLVSRPRAIVNLLVRSLYRALPRTLLERTYQLLFHR